MSEIHLFHDPDARPEEWRVEEIDSDGDGGCGLVIFSGPHAEQRAKWFAELLSDNRIRGHPRAEWQNTGVTPENSSASRKGLRAENEGMRHERAAVRA